jgi:hypothetical protein
MWITGFFGEPEQTILRNALEAASLIEAILHSHASRLRSRRHAEESKKGKKSGRRAGRGGGRAPREGASAPDDAHAPLLSAVRRDPVPATHRGIDPFTSHSDSKVTPCRDHDPADFPADRETSPR